MKTQNSKKIALPTKLAMSIATATALLGGYMGRAQAGSCTATAVDTYECSGPGGSDGAQNLSGTTSLTVTTTAGFGLNNTLGAGIDLSLPASATGSLRMTDSFDSDITSGLGDGIRATNDGSGELSITATGEVKGSKYGIRARNDVISNGIKITTGSRDIEGILGAGIGVKNNGGGVTVVESGYYPYDDGVGSIHSGTETGISIENNTNSNAVQVRSHVSVTGKKDGISVNNKGNSFISIYSAGPIVEGELGAGIKAFNAAGTATGAYITSLSSVKGGTVGIEAMNEGSGDILITTSGNVSGGEKGISAINGVDSNNITVDVKGGTIGGLIGVDISNQGGGATNLTISGTIPGGLYGVRVLSGSTTTSMNIDIEDDVTGGIGGLSIFHDGSSNVLPLTIMTKVIGGTFGIFTGTSSGVGNDGMTHLTLNAGADVSATSALGVGIINDQGASTVIINAGAKVTGSIKLREGSDTLTLNNGSHLGGLTEIDGGDDVSTADGSVDKLIINRFITQLEAADLQNWEEINITAGSLLNLRGGAELVTGKLKNTGGLYRRDIMASELDGIIIDGDYEGDNGFVYLRSPLSGTEYPLHVKGDTAGHTVIRSSFNAAVVLLPPGKLVVQVDGDSDGTFELEGKDDGTFEYEGDPIWIEDGASGEGVLYMLNKHATNGNWYMTSEAASCPLGDANDDHIVDILDVVELIELAKVDGGGVPEHCADTDGDGKIELDDVLYVIERILAKKPPSVI